MSNLENQAIHFAVCLDNSDYPASLEVGKLYRVIPDKEAAAEGYLRVVDESGEDYAFLPSRFQPVQLPKAIGKTLLATSSRSNIDRKIEVKEYALPGPDVWAAVCCDWHRRRLHESCEHVRIRIRLCYSSLCQYPVV